MNKPSRIPKRCYYGQAMQSPMSALRMQWKRRDEILKTAGYTGGTVLGFKLPYWQRGNDKWTTEQKVAFIANIYRGASIGTYMVNSTPKDDALDQILLDGLQRMTAVQEYWEGKLAVPGDDGVPHLWTDLTSEERAHFDRIPFPWIDTQYHTEEEAIAAYNHHNFGGTAHTEADRAVARDKS